ncbi:ABC transporter permease subunit [Streptococcus salivarius]|uniref:ABC transporter permease subunit n=1 Tax=Streptococcus salivarius TaxID=1304 RepID=UPI001C038299|nr:ABC transporter permease subunit [Streptococcus salivarius]MBT9616279.1 ABC transporter permease subunit [Streptococcus salivarius]
MSEVLSATNLKFLAQGMWTTLYLSFFIIVLSTLFGTILAVMRNGKNPILRWIASIYVEFVRNVPNLLWIFIIFLVFQLKSTAAGITSFTVFTSAALAEIIRGGLNSIDHGQTEAGLSQGFNNKQIFIKSQILMGGYYEPSQIFTLYGIVALAYFVVNFAISSYSRYLSKQWEQASE